MLNLHRLRLLTELRQRGTITEVARALSYSPSTVSQQLAALESEVGSPLITPVGRRVRLTRAGEVLAQRAELILAQVEEAEGEVRRAQNALAGVVRLACFQTAALALAPELLSQMQETSPGLQLHVAEIQPDEAVQRLAAHEYDMVLGEEYPGRPVERLSGVTITELARDELRVACPRGRKIDTLSDLAAADWVMEPEGNAARDWAVATCREVGFEPKVRFQSADLLVQVRLVETGHAVCLLPDMVWAHWPSDLQPQRLDPPQFRRIFTAVRAPAAQDRALIAVRSMLEAVAQTNLAQPPSS